MKNYRVHSGITLNEYSISIYSRIGRFPKNFIPVFDRNEDCDIYFWTDDNIFNCHEFNDKNYGWLTESRSIVPQTYINFEVNADNLLDNFVYIFSHCRKLVNRNEKIKWIPAGSTWIKKPQIYDKTKFVSMITSSKQMCRGHQKRLDFARKVNDHVDMFGHGIRPIEFKEEGLNDYMFSVAIENAEYSGYFTEKILDCFATGTIPIYLGDPDIGMEFNEDGIIKINDSFDITSLSPELYLSKIDAVIDNFNRAKKFLTVEDFIYENYLEKS